MFPVARARNKRSDSRPRQRPAPRTPAGGLSAHHGPQNLDIPQLVGRSERIAVENREIGDLAGNNRALLVVLTEEVGSAEGLAQR
jgi:hypothetical protein